MKSLSIQTAQKDQTPATGILDPLDKFSEAKNNELSVKQNNLVAEFRGRKDELVKKSEGFVYEYGLVSRMAHVNSGNFTPETILEIESALSSEWRSISLIDWSSELTFNRFTVFLCEILQYFFSSFKTKERIEGVELQKLSVKIFAYDRNLKVSELITVLNNATKGLYGHTFNRVDEETFFGWMKAYEESKALKRETKWVNEKPEQSNVARLSDDPNTEELKAYEIMQRRKKEIRDKVNSENP